MTFDWEMVIVHITPSMLSMLRCMPGGLSVEHSILVHLKVKVILACQEEFSSSLNELK